LNFRKRFLYDLRCLLARASKAPTIKTDSFFPARQQRKSELSNELVVEGEDSAPMSEVCTRSQMEAIEELEEEQE